MRLSTKGRFAVTAMIDVGLRANAGPVSLADISTRHRISLSYLEQLFSKLRQHGLVVSTRGPGGGYNLARNAEAISVADIVGAVEGTGIDQVKTHFAKLRQGSRHVTLIIPYVSHRIIWQHEVALIMRPGAKELIEDFLIYRGYRMCSTCQKTLKTEIECLHHRTPEPEGTLGMSIGKKLVDVHNQPQF